MLSFNDIRNTCHFVSENSKFVFIDNIKANEFAQNIEKETLLHWMAGAYGIQENLSLEKDLMFHFIFDLTSFCYWHEPKWQRIINSKAIGGSYSLIACYGDAIKKGIDLLNSDIILKLSLNDYAKILKGNTKAEIPLMKDRLYYLQETLKVIKLKYNNSLLYFIEKHNYDAEKMLNSFVTEFYGFNDIAKYMKKNIYILKRAQLTISDLAYVYMKHTNRSFLNIDKLTACADYKLPQVLRQWKVINFNTELTNIVENKQLIEAFSQQEIEIRANTIIAIDLITEEFNFIHKSNYSSMDINNLIWRMSQDKDTLKFGKHRTTTFCY